MITSTKAVTQKRLPKSGCPKAIIPRRLSQGDYFETITPTLLSKDYYLELRDISNLLVRQNAYQVPYLL